MGTASIHKPVMFVSGFISRYPDAIEWGLDKSIRKWGAISIKSEPFSFDETNYYEATMGKSLRITLAAFSDRIQPTDLPEIKHQTNALEHQFAETNTYREARPLNIDPGYLTLAKFVLATTKDAAHRLYLDNGIFGEITLKYVHKVWQDQPWTYPNYRRDDYKAFLMQCRDLF